MTNEVDSIKDAAATDKSAALAAAGKMHESAVGALQSQLQAAQAQVQAAQASASAQSQDSAELGKLRTIAATAEEKIAAQKAACVGLLNILPQLTLCATYVSTERLNASCCMHCHQSAKRRR